MAGILQAHLLLYCCRVINQNFQTSNVEEKDVESNGSLRSIKSFFTFTDMFFGTTFKRFLNGWIFEGKGQVWIKRGGKEKRRSQKPWRESKTLDHAWPHWIPFSRSKDAVSKDIVTHRLSLVTLDFYIVYFPTIFPRLFSSFELFRTSEHDNLPINIINDSRTN